MNEAERKGLFLANSLVESFLSVLLQDLQLGEDDEACSEGREPRDSGTIYDCPESTLRAALVETDAFRAKIAADSRLAHLLDDPRALDQIGSDLYMERAGHGVGFADRTWHDDNGEESAWIGERLSALVATRSSLETYLGDDGRAYVFGSEADD